MSLLKITDLRARIEGDGREILKGINLEIKPGEVHAIMGVNGSGKSTLANILGGKEGLRWIPRFARVRGSF
jgi:Fe-S cluster assembly ATP-binding protein